MADKSDKGEKSAKFISIDDINEAIEKIVKKISEMGSLFQHDLLSINIEQGRFTTSIGNVHTQILENKGRFDS
jgi:superfamily I DNA and RNA helicase